MGRFDDVVTWLGAVQPVISGETVGRAVSAELDDEQEHLGVGFGRVRLADDLAVWSLAAGDSGLDDAATGSYERVVAGWRLALSDSVPNAVRVCGLQGAEFGFPSRARPDLSNWPLLPHRPACVLPVLLVDPDGATLLVAAIDAFHEQVGAVGDGRVDVGWHGDLDAIPAGWSTRLAVIVADGPTAAIDRWGSLVARRARGRYDDALGRRLSYWTDNGAAYWYRTEPGHTVTSGLTATVADLAERGVPIGVVQLDSWWYPHETIRPFDTAEWVVPPSGMVRWEARDDILPGGLAPLAEALGGHPLAAHARHLAAASPYVAEAPCWVDGDRAHPSTPELYERLLDQCTTWGIETFEHDWLVECFHGVRQLRAAPGRAAAWQAGIDAAAASRGLTLQWCMATPADMATAAGLPRVTSVRTSGDHGYMVGPGFLWTWFLVVNRFARALGLWPYKDVFWSSREHADVEACLSALSAGPVGIGDPLGQADPEPLRPCHRGDGLLVKPDNSIAALDRCFVSWPFGRARLLAGECTSTHGAWTWTYLLAINPDDGGDSTARLVDTITLSELGVDSAALAWDWRRGDGVILEPDGGLDVDLAPHDWALFVLAPIVNGVAVVGDPTLYATAGDRRIGGIVPVGDDGVRLTVVGASGERVELAGWSGGEGVWRRTVAVGDRGWAHVEVRRGHEPG